MCFVDLVKLYSTVKNVLKAEADGHAFFFCLRMRTRMNITVLIFEILV